MLIRKNFVFCWEGGWERGVCAERDVRQKGSREQSWESVMVEGRWVKKGNFSMT